MNFKGKGSFYGTGLGTIILGVLAILYGISMSNGAWTSGDLLLAGCVINIGTGMVLVGIVLIIVGRLRID